MVFQCYLNMKYHSINTPLLYEGEDFTDVPSLTEPGDCPTMKQIVERFVRGIDPGVSVYDDYDEDEPVLPPGGEIFDLLNEELRSAKQKSSKSDNDGSRVSGPIPETKTEGSELKERTTDASANEPLAHTSM